MTEYKLKELICEIGRRVYNKGFAAANDGNISVRLSAREVLCTPTMVCKGFMRPEDLCKVDYEGNQTGGTRKRSSEILLHLAVYKNRPDVQAVVHCHPPHATAFGVAHEPVPKCVLPEVEVFLGEVPMTAYETPGGQKFADTVVPFVKDCNTIILANHGTLSFGPDLEKAYWNTEILDAYCRILVLARQLGRVNFFDEGKTKELLDLKKRLGYDDVRFHKPGCALCGDSTFDDSYTEFVPRAHAFARDGAACACSAAGRESANGQAGAADADALVRAMFSFRRDKVGFFAGLTLMSILGLAAVLTVVFVIVGWAVGDWSVFDISVRWILGVTWVLLIATVLVRVYIFDWQMKRRGRAAPPPPAAAEGGPLPPGGDGLAAPPAGGVTTPGGPA
jgi:L-fuculose-phosphate aldolase